MGPTDDRGKLRSPENGDVAVTSTLNADLAALLSERSVTRFVYREARLIDDRQLEDWLDLWTDDACYWVPADETNGGLHRVQLVLDDRDRLGERVYRLTHADAHSQEPYSRTTHLITGVEVGEPDNDQVEVHAALALVEVRRGVQEIYAGRIRYRLRVVDGELKFAEKFVRLSRNDAVLGNLTFVI